MFVDSGGLSLSELLATRIGFASAMEVLLSVACCWTEAIISKTQPLRPRVCTEIPGEKNRMMSVGDPFPFFKVFPNPLKVGIIYLKKVRKKIHKDGKSSKNWGPLDSMKLAKGGFKDFLDFHPQKLEK